MESDMHTQKDKQIDEIGDTGLKHLVPKKLAALYRALGTDYDSLFLKAPDRSISYIWQALGIEHSLQPSSDNFTAPEVPALTIRGFVRWQSIQILLGPEEHVPPMQYAVRQWNLVHPDTGERFPSDLPAHAFPTCVDKEVDAWHVRCAELLREKAESSPDVVAISPDKENLGLHPSVVIDEVRGGEPPGEKCSPESRSRRRPRGRRRRGERPSQAPNDSRVVSPTHSDDDNAVPFLPIIPDGGCSTAIELGALTKSATSSDLGDQLEPASNSRSTSIFSSFKAVQWSLDCGKRTYRLRRSVRIQRQSCALPSCCYRPYSEVKNRSVLRSLYRIVETTQFLDAVFAEYFRVAVPHSEDLASELSAIKAAINACQRLKSGYLGDLGKFCEQVTEHRLSSASPEFPTEFRFSDLGIGALAYIQDGLEVPYWSLMVNIIISSHKAGINDPLGDEILLRALNDARLSIYLHQSNMMRQHAEDVPEDILEGILARTSILDRLVDEIPAVRVDNIHNQLSLTSITPSYPEPADASDKDRLLGQDVPSGYKAHDWQAISISLLTFVFLASAIVPAFIGFAKAYSLGGGEDGIGSRSDPDYMWIIANAVLAVLGSFLSILPLFQSTNIWCRSAVFLLISVSTALAFVSIGTYPVLNKAWSSMFSFFSTFFALGSVYVSTPHSETRKESAPAQNEMAIQRKNQ
ncbi:hypothetical protein F4778DRAFT_240535 [Xylariomycetidae sp. FL2044]|nr:hypothetical protein F4778DRAFT_240535 [Xylariomycetidae sp. FL2044]